MVAMKNHPAVFAGLVGGPALGVPTIAFAAPLDGIADTIAGSLVLQFAVGCAAGAIVAGSIAFVAERIYVHKGSDDANDASDQKIVLDKNDWTYTSVNLAEGLSPDLDDDVTRVLNSYHAVHAAESAPSAKTSEEAPSETSERATSETVELSRTTEMAEAVTEVIESRRASKEGELRQAPEATSVEGAPRHMRRPRHFAAGVTVRMVTKDAAKRTARHFSSSEMEQLTVAIKVATEESVRRGRHYASSTSQEMPAPEALVANDDTFEHLEMHRLMDEAAEVEAAEVEAAEVEAAEVEAPAPESAPVTAAKKPGLLERVAAGTRGLRKVLSSRLARLDSSSTLDDIPVIQRANGSATEYAHSDLEHAVAPAAETIASSLESTVNAASPDERQTSGSVTHPEVSDTSRVSYISRHVSEVDLGVFPELRRAEELGHHDMWEEALEAMGENLDDQSTRVIFRDEVGGPSTIDDPDGLEAPTEFIIFRPSAAQTQATDNDTYVDYLLRDELSHSDVEVLRNSPHAHLRVIEGGTGPVRVRRRAGEHGAHVRVGRHYAPQSLAQEA